MEGGRKQSRRLINHSMRSEDVWEFSPSNPRDQTQVLKLLAVGACTG